MLNCEIWISFVMFHSGYWGEIIGLAHGGSITDLLSVIALCEDMNHIDHQTALNLLSFSLFFANMC